MEKAISKNCPICHTSFSSYLKNRITCSQKCRNALYIARKIINKTFDLENAEKISLQQPVITEKNNNIQIHPITYDEIIIQLRNQNIISDKGENCGVNLYKKVQELFNNGIHEIDEKIFIDYGIDIKKLPYVITIGEYSLKKIFSLILPFMENNYSIKKIE